MLSKLYIVTLFAIGVLSQHDCDYGTFEVEEATGECKFDCEYESRYLAKDAISFELIKDSCSNVRRAADAYPSLCTKDTLVWPETCGCPYCPCTTVDAVGETKEVIKYISKECLNCKCTQLSDYYGITEPVYDCDEVAEVYGVSEPQTWKSWQCPPAATCEVTDYYGTDIKIPGNMWLQDQETSDDKCETVCTCNADGTTDCLTGWTNTFANDQFQDYIQYECGWELVDCLNEPDRIFTDDVGPYCSDYSCPKCDCGAYSLGQSWFTDFTNPWSAEEICVECRCVADSYDNPYAECFDDSSFYYASGDECERQTENILTLECHDGYSYDSATVGTLNSETCSSWYYGDDKPEETILFCNNEYYQWNDDEYTDYYWGCEDTIFPMCEVFGINDGCISYELTFREDICDETRGFDTYKGYEYCCSTANCNHQDIDISSCTPADEYKQLEKDFQDCLYGTENSPVDDLLVDFYCDKPLAIGQDITCDDIEEIYTHILGCYCNAYTEVYELDALSDATRIKLQAAVDELTSIASQYNGLTFNDEQCDITLECDLEGNTGIENVAAQKYDRFGVFVGAFAGVLVMYYA